MRKHYTYVPTYIRQVSLSRPSHALHKLPNLTIRQGRYCLPIVYWQIIPTIAEFKESNNKQSRHKFANLKVGDP